jgi:hypothetical protein
MKAEVSAVVDLWPEVGDDAFWSQVRLVEAI